MRHLSTPRNLIHTGPDRNPQLSDSTTKEPGAPALHIRPHQGTHSPATLAHATNHHRPSDIWWQPTGNGKRPLSHRPSQTVTLSTGTCRETARKYTQVIAARRQRLLRLELHTHTYYLQYTRVKLADRSDTTCVINHSINPSLRLSIAVPQT